MPEPVSQTERDLKEIGLSRSHHRALNEYLKAYGIDVHRVPYRGWRAWRMGRKDEHWTYAISWFGADVLADWMNDPHAKAMEFLDLKKMEATCARR